MKIAILGFAGQGKSSYEHWNKDGNEVVIHDMATDIAVPEGAQAVLGDTYLQNLDSYDLLVRTPRLHPRDILAANSEAPDILAKVTTNTNEFLRICPTKNIIGVTGTKGKGTTTTLIAKMLHTAGLRVHLGGNIGLAPLDMLRGDGALFEENKAIQPDDWVVLELANFQLIDLKQSPHIGVCLMVVPEHMDWHEDMEEYMAAKQQMFMNQDDGDIAIYYAKSENSLSVADATMGELIPYMEAPGALVLDGVVTIAGQEICSVDKIKLLGAHNWQNICAAITAVWQVTQDTDAIHKVVTTFGGLEYHLEKIADIDGVSYYNDSFGTTPETTIVALEAFKQPKVAIIGGSDKGASYDALAQAVIKNNVRTAVLIGDTAPAIQSALQAAGFKNFIEGGTTMKAIIDTARSHAVDGDVIVLSPGCASFGLFENYKDRGRQFTEVVKALAATAQ